MERGRIQRLPKYFGYPLLSQERVKLRTSNFVRTFIASMEQKPMKNAGNSSDGRSQGVAKVSGHPCIGRMGALRGHLYDSTAFLYFLPRDAMRCAVLVIVILYVRPSVTLVDCVHMVRPMITLSSPSPSGSPMIL